MNLLFTNIGRRTYFIDFAMELCRRGYPIHLTLSDVSENTASFWADKNLPHFLMPRVISNEARYAELLLEKCKELNMEAVIPFIDFELELLAAKKSDFLKNGIRVIVSDEDLVRKCMDKKLNYELCRTRQIPTPRSYFSSNGLPDFPRWVKKQVAGCSSAGMEIIDAADLKKHIDGKIFDNGFMLQEFIEGEEYGMNILNDLDGNFVHAVFCKKLLMRAGETDKGFVFYSEEFQEWAKRLSRALGHIGNMDVDFIVNKKGEFFFLDFNPRFGGLYPAAHLAGYNYLEYILCMLLKRPFKIPSGRKNFTFMKGISLYSYDE